MRGKLFLEIRQFLKWPDKEGRRARLAGFFQFLIKRIASGNPIWYNFPDNALMQSVFRVPGRVEKGEEA